MIALSKRQHAMLETLIDLRSGFMTIEDAQRFDQRPFRSMLIQKWVAYRPGKGFHVTKEGIAAWEEYNSAQIIRQNPNAPLTRFFDLDAYGLAPRKVAKGAA